MTFKTNVDEALQFFGENEAHIALLILDIMMPPGTSFGNGEAELGRRTGVLLYEAIRQQQACLPIVILTNVYDKQLEEWLCQDSHCRFRRKLETLPEELVETVECMLRPPEMNTRYQNDHRN